MCQVCGCGPENIRIDGKGDAELDGSHEHHHHHHDGHHHHHDGHDHGHSHHHGHDGDHHHDNDPRQVENPRHSDLHFGKDAAKTHVPGMSQKRLVQIEQEILAKNGMFADDVRGELCGHGVLGLNLIASPGAGKTTLLVETLQRLKGTFPTWVIEGDQETSNDADRIRATDTQAVQINTGKGCHLDADMIQRALASLSLQQGGVLFIENVGNLACPAGFDLGEAHKVVILSVTEGDDKPVKYPEAFAAADLLVISKSDLAPYCDFDIEACVARAREVNPLIETIVVSARDGTGMTEWLDWIVRARQQQLQDLARDLQTRVESIRNTLHA
ncbi:hydrogenase nickel incorporation protein HypB [Aminobacter anthyllidis]|uniref:Hydrogenase maturation factor HypB n=2 Tax=Aminobacter anthyllidis TaxID=1035067 RepID=A0A9X1ABM2_9HYPH|nr:hydrogenase nickel incorporation protein HypB [Aminobacter anthyllidis]